MAAVDNYVRRYLQAAEPIALDMDGKGQTQQFSGEDLSVGKELFETHCLNCHVGGGNFARSNGFTFPENPSWCDATSR